ncbi:bacterio-opsin activator domain-containing protein [Halosimplex salinum]|uniref:bacterio-opsin activator domain-containing protein n=1 Tax=Halosimplex salinum TaxID=1710538 RepID=UPI000F4642B7|nr:bacterio-opsin activator domain-containing protein [Halosimplex salinum]
MGNAGITESLSETIAVFESIGAPGEPMTTSEVADHLDVSRRSTYDRLERLVDHELLRTKKAGSRGRVWWQPIGTLDASPDRSAADRELAETRERFQHLFEHSTNVIYVADPETGDIVDVNPAGCETLGYTREELLELGPSDLHPAEMERFETFVDSVFAEGSGWTDDLTCLTSDGEPLPTEISASKILADDRELVLAIVRDVSEREEHGRELARQREELERRERALRLAYEVVSDPGREFSEQIDDLLAIVRRTLGTDYATLSRVQSDEYVFEAISAPVDADLAVGDTVALSWTNCERVVETERTLVLNDVEADAPELADRPGNADWGIACYLGSPVFVGDEVYGSFCFYDRDARSEDFSDWEVAFVDLLGNWVSSELERQQYTERVTALNELNSVVHELTDAVIEQSTRDEIERVACEQLAAADAYEFAWIAEVDPNTREITPRAEAGIENFLRNVERSTDADDQSGPGPAGTTFRTGEMVVSRDVFEDPAFEPYRDHAETYGFRSFAAIPIVHGECLYGVLGVYSDRSGAFAENERNVLRQLGEVIGHAIAGVERQRALMGDELLELEFRVHGPLEAVDVPGDGRITLAGTVPVGGDEYVVYGNATPGSAEAVEALVDAVPHWDSVSFHGEDRERFELRLSDSRIHSTLASLGGYVESAVVEDGEFRSTLHLPGGTDVRPVIKAVRSMFPGAEMVKRRQVATTRETGDGVHGAFAEGLTDRQRATLRAAYYAGFFDWPRETSGEEVAASLDISPPTFHQHLRKAERKVFESLLSEPL